MVRDSDDGVGWGRKSVAIREGGSDGGRSYGLGGSRGGGGFGAAAAADSGTAAASSASTVLIAASSWQLRASLAQAPAAGSAAMEAEEALLSPHSRWEAAYRAEAHVDEEHLDAGECCPLELPERRICRHACEHEPASAPA